ncbi:MAG TPA: DUF5995 family protein [Nocardioidaceae bacterium]
MAHPRTVEDVIDRLVEIDASLPAHDGVAVFNRMYLTVTERVLSALEARDVFADPGFMAELDVRFAGLWLDAYDDARAGREVCRAWRPLFEHREARGLLPIQFALSGMNAHIEHDLPLAVLETCRSRGAEPTGVRHDYEGVNDILASVESEVRRSFLSELGRQVDDRMGPLVHLVSSWNIDKARDLAWVSVESLWAIRRLGFLVDRYTAALAGTVGMVSRYLLTPVVR